VGPHLQSGRLESVRRVFSGKLERLAIVAGFRAAALPALALMALVPLGPAAALLSIMRVKLIVSSAILHSLPQGGATRAQSKNYCCQVEISPDVSLRL